MLTFTRYMEFVAMAGPDHTWEGVPGSRPSGSDAKIGELVWLRDFATTASDVDGNIRFAQPVPICVFCDRPSANGQVAHIIAGGKTQKGHIGGNVAYGCISCNTADKGPNGQFRNVEYRTILRPDLIPTIFPTYAELVELGKNGNPDIEDVKRLRGM